MDRRLTELPQQQYMFGQYVLVFVQTEDGKSKQVNLDQEQQYWIWKWVPHKPGES